MDSPLYIVRSNANLTPRAVLATWSEKVGLLGSHKKEGAAHTHNRSLTVSSWEDGPRNWSLEHRPVKIRPCDGCCTAIPFQQYSGQRMKQHVHHESRGGELTCVLCTLSFFLRSAQNHRNHVVFTAEIQSSWPDMGTQVVFLAAKRHPCISWFLA